MTQLNIAHVCSPADRDKLFSQLEEMNEKHEQMRKELEAAEQERTRRGELELELEKAKQDRQEALDERDRALSSSLMAKTERERQILRLFKRAAEETLGPDPKKPKENKSEFELDGQKTIPAKYEEMDLTNLLNIASVEPKCREMIGQNIFFELKALQKGSEIEQQRVVVQNDDGETPAYYVVGSSPKSHDLKTRPQLFYVLYSWGQFYLQCFPQKTAAFLEYLAFMTKYGVVYSVPTLVKLDNKIRQFYVQHPQLNWHMTSPQVQRFLLDANIDLQQENAQFNTFATPVKQKQKSRRRGGGGSRRQQGWQQNQGQGQRFSSGHSQGGSWDQNSNSWDQRDRDWEERQNRCRNYNFRQCRDRNCPRDHVCYYCGARNHKARQCRYG